MRLIAISAAAALFVVVGVALATPGSNVISAPVLARGLLGEELKLKIKEKEDSDVVVQQITIGPGGHTGWHSHPGVVVVVVKAGTLTYYSADDPTCTGVDYNAGDSFVDPGHEHVHIARNEGSTNLELYATYFEVPPGGGFRIDKPAPGNCPF